MYMYMFMYMYMYMYMFLYMYMYMYMYMYVYVYVCVYTYIHTHTFNVLENYGLVSVTARLQEMMKHSMVLSVFKVLVHPRRFVQGADC